jgi:hypothetical protein
MPYMQFTSGYNLQSGDAVLRRVLMKLQLEEVDVEDMAKENVADLVNKGHPR